MLLIRKHGSTSNVFRVTLRDSTTGQGKTGLTTSSTGLVIGTICDNEAVSVAYTAAGNTIETITTLGTFATPTATKCRFKEVDSTSHAGLYEIQLDNARFAVSNAKILRVAISGVSGLLLKDVTIQLTATDVDDAIHGGMSALPNTACTTNGSLITSGTGAAQLSVSSGAVADVLTVQTVNLPVRMFSYSTSNASSIFDIVGGLFNFSFQGQSSIVTDLGVQYDDQYVGSLLAIHDGNSGMHLVTRILGSIAVSDTLVLQDAIPDLGAEDDISFLIIPGDGLAPVAPDNASISAIKAKTDNLPNDPADQSILVGLIDDLPTNTELATALGTSDDATLAAVEVLRKLLRADHYIDNSTTPWALVYMQEGTGGIGVGVELFRKQLKSVAGSNLTSTDTVVGQAKT